MKKILLIGLLALTAACQSAASAPAPESRPTSPLQTPTAPATVISSPTGTATLTSTPTFTPTPVPLFFTEEFASDLSAWSSFITSGGTSPQVGFENGSLKLNFSSPNTWYYALHNAHEYETVHVEAKFNSAGEQPASVGLICNYSESDGWFEYNINTDGTYSILLGQWLAADIARYTPIVNDSSEYLPQNRTDYEIGLTCEPDTLWLYINGKLFRKINVARYELKEGKAGIAAAVFENVPVTAYFEWFKVTEPAE